MSTDDRTTLEDEYPTRPDATKIAAAQRRQRGEQPKVASAASTVPIPPHYKLIVFGVAAVLLVSVFALLVAKYPASSPKPLATPQVDTRATDAALVLGLPVTPQGYSTSTPVLVETIDAYAAPDGALLGPVELSRPMRAVAHCRQDWIQADVDGSGLVWLPSPNVNLPIVGPDLCAVPTVPPQIGRGLAPVVEQPAAESGATIGGADPGAEVAPAAAPAVVEDVLRIRLEDDCNSEHGRCTPPCTAEHGRCKPGD